ncbi:MAG TPA: hypothetical protein VND64_32215 [Pirellulales bacterium]|nr:hypothetical protein [Pirellulales bacterium]
MKSALAATAVVSFAALLLFFDLGGKYLWQDEAATAVLARRLVRFGTPRAYDGVNLISLDHFAAEDEAEAAARAGDPRAAVNYYISRGDLKADTTWKWQPWGQFVVAGGSFLAFGESTWPARFPFAMAGLATVIVLFHLVWRESGDLSWAVLSATLLSCNGYWILHCRQCRYYSLTSLGLVLTLAGYIRWQNGKRGGAASFVSAAWLWFQMDYGTIWPVLAILFADACRVPPRQLWRPVLVGLLLGLSLAPFVFYYELWGRMSVATGTWATRFARTVFDTNAFLVPLPVLAAAGWLSFSAKGERSRLPRLAVLCVAALQVWVPSVAPAAFFRYQVAIAPLAALLTAWTALRLVERLFAGRRLRLWLAAAITSAIALTPLLSAPGAVLVPRSAWPVPTLGTPFRDDLVHMLSEVFGSRPDPNAVVISWLAQHARPEDEILVNYEDVPLMFYLPNPVRGGIAAFRVTDDRRAAPRFAILRRSVSFVHWSVFRRELARHDWVQVPLHAPDLPWGNNPDPGAQPTYYAPKVPDLLLLERRN